MSKFIPIFVRLNIKYMWYDSIRKYDNSPGIELFEWDSGTWVNRTEIGKIYPIYRTIIGDVYAFTEYDTYTHPIWRVIIKNGYGTADRYVWTMSMPDMTPAIYTLINDGIVVSRGVAVIILSAAGVWVYRHDSPRTKRVLRTNEFESLDSKTLCELLYDNGYDPVLF